MDSFYVFGSYYSVHMDNDHADKTNKNVTAAPCVYLCNAGLEIIIDLPFGFPINNIISLNAGHFKSKGHVVWDYKRRRRLIVPEISRNIWNTSQCAAAQPNICRIYLHLLRPGLTSLLASATKISAIDEIDPSSDDFPNTQVRLGEAETTLFASDTASSPKMATISKHKTRQRDRMFKYVGTKIRRVFFINGPNGPTDFFEGVVRSVTAANKYDVVYDNYEQEEMGEAAFKIYKMKVKDQIVAKLANVQSARFWKDAHDCNCAIGHCYHPWSKDSDTSGFNPKEGGGICSRLSDTRIKSAEDTVKCRSI